MSEPAGDVSSAIPDDRRRYLTVLFSDLSDSTQLSEKLEAEDYAGLLKAWRSLCHDIIPRHGGQIARIQGDGVLALFGYPEPREDDGRRATEAALELHAAVARVPMPGGGPLTLHSGIHAGLVLVSSGDVERGRFELLGSVPNVAARLSGLADHDDILVSEETLGPQAHLFTTNGRQTVQIKGRTEPLTTLRILGRAAVRSRFEAMSRSGLGPFVGRERPLRKLRQHLRMAIVGQPQCVMLCAEPGMGKTRLVEQLLRHAAAAQCRVLRGYCERYLSAEPLQPFVQMVRALAPDSTSPPDPTHEAALRGERSAICALFESLAASQPLLIVIDDWQWADEASQQLLDAVRAIHRAVCVIVISRAAPDVTSAPMSVVELLPLDVVEAAQLVRHLLPSADPFMVAEIHRYAGGIPLFIEELCHSAATLGTRWASGLRAGNRAWLNTLIESRVELLPPEQVALLRAAAVIGNVVPGWLLTRIAGHGPDDLTVAALAAKDFVFPGEQPGTLRFKHGIARDVIYDAVSLHERRQLHRRIAAALQDRAAEQSSHDELLESLAYHCAAGDLTADAAAFAERAGDKAMAASALDRARMQYAAALQALDAGGPLPTAQQLHWCAVAQKLGMACVFDPLALEDGLITFERAAALARQCSDLPALARAEYWLGYLCYAKGLARSAIVHCEAALDLATQLADERLAAQVRATLGQALLSACQYERALPLLDAALDSKRRQARPGSGIAVGSAYALACKGYLLGDRGAFDAADACFAEALQLLGGVRHQVAASVLHWLSVVYQWQGRWEEALRAADEASAIAEQVKSRQQLAMGRALAGHARWMLTRDAKALQGVREATAWVEARNGGLAISLNHAWLVEGALAGRRFEEGRQHAAKLFQRARAADRIGEALGCRALALGAANVSDFARAERYLRLAERSAEIRHSEHERASNALCRAQIEIARGNGTEARRSLDVACTAFQAMGMRWHLERARQFGG